MDPAAPISEVVPTRLFRNDGVLQDRLTLVRVAIYIVDCPRSQTRRGAFAPRVRAEGSTPRSYHQCQACLDKTRLPIHVVTSSYSLLPRAVLPTLPL